MLGCLVSSSVRTMASVRTFTTPADPPFSSGPEDVRPGHKKPPADPPGARAANSHPGRGRSGKADLAVKRHQGKLYAL